MIKGKYVATIVLNICYDENMSGILPFEKVREKLMGGELDKTIVELLSDEIGDGFCSVGLNRQYADLYRTEGGDGK